MSYAKVMASLNASSAASGVEVEVKKRTPDGSYIPADDRDFATADFDAELEAGSGYKPNKADWRDGKWAGFKSAEVGEDPRRGNTGVAIAELKERHRTSHAPVLRL